MTAGFNSKSFYPFSFHLSSEDNHKFLSFETNESLPVPNLSLVRSIYQNYTQHSTEIHKSFKQQADIKLKSDYKLVKFSGMCQTRHVLVTGISFTLGFADHQAKLCKRKRMSKLKSSGLHYYLQKYSDDFNFGQKSC